MKILELRCCSCGKKFKKIIYNGSPSLRCPYCSSSKV